MGRVAEEPAQPLAAGPLHHSGREGRAPVVLGPVELQAEHPLHQAVGVGLDPPSPQGLGEPVVGADEAAADAVHHLVDVAGDGRHQRGQLGLQPLLGLGADRAQDGVGVVELGLEFGQGVQAPGEVEAAEPVADLMGGHLEPGRVPAQQVLEPFPHVVHPEHGVVDGLVQAHPQAQVVGVQRPGRGQLVDVGQTDQHRPVRGAGDGQFVTAEGPLGELAHHRPGGQRHHHRPHHLGDPGQHGPHRVVGLGGRGQPGRDGRAQGGEEVAVVVDGAVRPVGAVGHLHPQRLAAAGGGQAGGLGRLQLGHPHELLDGDPLGGVDVGLGLPAGGDAAGHLAAPVGAGLARVADHPHQLAHERKRLEGVLRLPLGWIVAAHGGMV